MDRVSDEKELELSSIVVKFPSKDRGNDFQLEVNNLNHQQLIDLIMYIHNFRDELIHRLSSEERMKYMRLDNEWSAVLNNNVLQEMQNQMAAQLAQEDLDDEDGVNVL